MGLKANLEKIGCSVVGQASTEPEALALFRQHKPSIVLMDIRLDGADGIDLAAKLLAERHCAMVMVSAYSDAELIRRAGAVGIYGYLIKPASREALAAQIEVAVNRCKEHQQLLEQAQSLAENLEKRKLIEKAKGILMKRLKLDENTAHRTLQLECQKRRITITEFAKKVIESEEIMKR
jgi:response regulator NasT